MQDTLKNLVQKFKQEQTLHRRLVAILVAAVMLVSLATTWALHIQGYAMERKELACGKPEHTHTDACYEMVLTCGQEEGHVHSDACYTYQSVLSCQEPEHTHSDECYDADGNLTCEQTEHVHDTSCYTQELVLTCDKTETGHVHTDACYTKQLVCKVAEHTHSDNCYTDPEADVETAEDWEDTLPEEKDLTGEWSHDVVAVAESQLDYAESTANWQLGEDGETHKGYTRYGAWYGAPYEDWCAMFASFCLHYAGVPEEAIPHNASCPGWVSALQEQTIFVSPEAEFIPQPGDLVFLNFDPADQEDIDEELSGTVADRAAQHVALVKEYDAEHNVLYAYEGNSNNKVQIMAYLMPEYVEPTEEDQQDLPEEERFHTPEISMQLHDKSIVGYVSLQFAKDAFDKKYPNGLPTEETDNEESGSAADATEPDVVDDNNVQDTNLSTDVDTADAEFASTLSIPGNDEAFGNNRRVVFKVMIDGEWQTVGIKDGYIYENGSAYISTYDAMQFLAPYGYTGSANQEIGYAMPNDLYYGILATADNTYCLDVGLGSDNAASQGDNVQLYKFYGTDNQIYKFTNNNNGTYCMTLLTSIKAGGHWFNINLNGNIAQADQNIQIWDDTTPASNWILKETVGGHFVFLTNQSSNWAIDIPSAWMYNGNNIRLWERNGATAQMFDLLPTHLIENTHNYSNRIYLGSNNGSDVICYYMPGMTANLNTSDQWCEIANNYSVNSINVDPNNQAGQKNTLYVKRGNACTVTGLPNGYDWSVTNANGDAVSATATDVGNGTITLRIDSVNERLEVYPSTKRTGYDTVSHKVTFKVHMNGEWRTVGSQPYYHYDGSRAYITDKEAKAVFEQYGYTATSDPGYTFAYSYGDMVKHLFYYNTANKAPTSKVLDIDNGSANYKNGGVIQLYEFNGSSAQAFQFVPTGHSGCIAIKPALADYYVNVNGGVDKGNDTPLQLYNDYWNDISCHWKLVNTAFGTEIRSGDRDQFCIDVPNNNVADRQTLHIWENGDNRYWDIRQTRLMFNDVPAAAQYDGSYRIMLAPTDSSDIVCYYIPQYKDAGSNGIGRADKYTEMAPNWPDLSAYTISVIDDQHIKYNESQLSMLTTSVVAGGTTDFVLDEARGYNWVAVGDKGGAVKGTNENGKTTLHFENVDQSYRISLSSANPEFSASYIGVTQQPRTNGTNPELAVFDTSGQILPNTSNAGKDTNKVLYLVLDGNGNVVYDDVEVKLFTDKTFSLAFFPTIERIDGVTDRGNYRLSRVVVKNGDMTQYDGDPNGVSLTTRTDLSGKTSSSGKKYVFISNATHIDLHYEQTHDENYKMKTLLLDYDIMFEGNNVSSNGTDGRYNANASLKDTEQYAYTTGGGWNNGINYTGNMTFNNGGDVAENYKAQYLFGNINTGVRHATTWNRNGNFSDYGQYVMTEDRVFGRGYRINGSSMYYFRNCAFGLVKDTLSADGQLQFQDCIAYPKNLFDNVPRADKHIMDQYSLVFDRKGDNYILRNVAGTADGDNGYMYTDLRQLKNPGGHTNIFTNNFWPFDRPTSEGGWDGYRDGGRNPSHNDPMYGASQPMITCYSDFPMYNSSTGYVYGTNGKVKAPASDDGADHNNLFGMRQTIPFTLSADYIAPMSYLFYGDDDLWVYLCRKSGTQLPNGQSSQLICDIGGVHSSAGEYVNIRDYLPEGSEGEYTLEVFYTERGNSGSTCYMNVQLGGINPPKPTLNTVASLTKVVNGADDPNKEFEFYLTVTDSNGNILPREEGYVYTKTLADGTVEYQDGFCVTGDGSTGENNTIRLKADETINLLGLPLGSEQKIIFKEQSDSGYSTNASIPGRPESDYVVRDNGHEIEFKLSDIASNNAVTFVNTPITTSASVTKDASKYRSAPFNENPTFDFQVNAWYGNSNRDREWAVMEGYYNVTVTDASGNVIDGAPNSMQISWNESEHKLYNTFYVDGLEVKDDSGNTRNFFQLHDGETFTIVGLPSTARVGFYERIYDANDVSWSWDASAGTFRQLTPDSTHAEQGDSYERYIGDGVYFDLVKDSDANKVVCTNTPVLTSATLTKWIMNHPVPTGNEDREFNFLVRIYDKNGVELSSAIKFAATGALNTVGSGDTFTLQKDGAIQINNLPVGYSIAFFEEPGTDYTTDWQLGTGNAETVTASNGWIGRKVLLQKDSASNAFICKNTIKVVSASVTKKVVGAPAESTQAFNFRVVLRDRHGNLLVGDYPYAIVNANNELQSPADATIKLGGDVPAEFALQNNWTFTISDIPADATVYFYEQTAVGYGTTWDKAEGSNITLTPDATISSEFGSGVFFQMQDDNNNVICTNKTGAELPAAGGSGTAPFVIGGLLLMTFVFMYTLLSKRRRLNEGE